ncbi:MarR family winged helix-turn-helix transcriptional regulator [Nocardioides aquiterrae]|uniref:TyrZ transcriptional regulator YwaE n=1 Tax=Nocardioides aquiterrae TaxID=203799 RepID=A0ABN1USV7_9ACTN
MTTARYVHECEPSRCPCDDASCTLSRYVRDASDLDITAMAVVSQVHRAAHALRCHLERTVLTPHGLTWTGWVVLWVLWVWGETESRVVAAEAGLSKATLTGVQHTLIGRGLVQRRVHPEDRRRVLLSSTEDGRRLTKQLLPELNAAEAWLTDGMDDPRQRELARGLRTLVKRAEQG